MITPATGSIGCHTPVCGILIFLSVCVPAAATDFPSGTLVLSNGDAFAGQLRPSESPNILSWQSNDFKTPFRFDIATIAQLRFNSSANLQRSGNFIVHCAGGDLISGEIVRWDQEKLVLRSQSLGDVAIRCDRIIQLQRLESEGQKRVQFLSDLQNWQTISGWTQANHFLVSSSPNSFLCADFQIPSRLGFDIQLAWTGRADFTFAIGIDPQRDPNSSHDGWRLETVSPHLAALREHDLVADIAPVADVSQVTSIHLTGFLDQQTGEFWLFDSQGQQLTKITGPKGRIDGSGIRLVNRGESLRLERLLLWPWAGRLPYQQDDLPIQIDSVGVELVSTEAIEFDSDQKTLVVTNHDEPLSIELSKVDSVQFSTKPSQVLQPRAVFRLQAGLQVSGEILAVDQHRWLLSSDQFFDDLHVPLTDVQTLELANSDSEALKLFDTAPGSVRNGHRVAIIEIGQSRHLGWICGDRPNSGPQIESSDLDGLSAIWWQPISSETASPLNPDVSGCIRYSAITAALTSTASNRSPAPGGQIRRSSEADFGQLFLQRVDRVEATRSRRDQHTVHLVCGDVISCRVDSIDESGVYVSTSDEEGIQVPHREIKAIELISKAILPEIDLEKRKRLLTLPRLQKSSPPSHLLVSHDGDLLRCSLIRMDHESMVVEVQMEEQVIPRDRITHIIWLQPTGPSTQSPDSPSTDATYAGQLQAVTTDGKRITFRPTKSSRSEIRGDSRILGESRVPLERLQQITLGQRIDQEAAQLMYADWKLRPAQEPIVMQEAADSAVPTSDTSLIDQAAAPIFLERLDGGNFELSQHRGKIVVIDFWASWCAPCMRTMPLIHHAVGEFDSQKVMLVAINLEERPEIVRDAIERLNLDMNVVLDVDGVTAGSYLANAIPYTVVVAPDGRIKDVIVGGGPQAIEKLKGSLTELLRSF